jgi:hypothetical protein
MAISETSLKDVALMTIQELNARGGVLGKKIEPVVVDPASNWPLFAEKARQLLTKDKVRGGLRLLDLGLAEVGAPGLRGAERAPLLPVQYEGEELSQNVFYTGAAPNQQAIPAVEYLMSREGGGATRFFLLGTDYVYRGPPTRSSGRSSTRRESPTRTSRRSTRRSATATTRPSSRRSKRSGPAGTPRSSPPSTATPTFPSTRSSAIRA